MNKLFIIATAMLMSWSAQAQVATCIDQGKLVFSDSPCGELTTRSPVRHTASFAASAPSAEPIQASSNAALSATSESANQRGLAVQQRLIDSAAIDAQTARKWLR